MKKLILLLIAGSVLLISIIMLKGCVDTDTIPVTTDKVQKRTIVETVSANGKIQPEVEVKISSDVSGQVVELLVKEGDKVQKGDVLAKINPDIYESTIERVDASVNAAKANAANAAAQLAQMKAQFTNAEASFNRNKKLFEQEAISQADFDAANASYESTKANLEGTEQSVKGAEFGVKSSEASLKEANDNLRKTTIYAPANGTVSKLNIEKGERVVGTAQMTGTEMMILANLNEMEVRVEVNENDIMRVHLNDTADIEVEAYLERKFKGIVTEIANSANTTGVTADQITNFVVKIRILQESYKDLLDPKFPNISPFRPGMTATVDVRTKTAFNVLSLPIQAVTTRIDSTLMGIDKNKKKVEEDEDKIKVVDEKAEKRKEKEQEIKAEECVFVYVDGTAKLAKVKSGIQDNNFIEIVSGIKEGGEVISGPYNAVSRKIKEGSKVKKVDKSQLFKGVSAKPQ